MRPLRLKRPLRPLVAAATVAAGLGFAVPAHAETVVVDVTVSTHLGATAFASSDKPGETFSPVSVQRVAVTNAGVDTSSGTPTVGDIAGVTTGSATYVITAHPAGQTNEAFNFVAVVECVLSPVTGLVCTPSAGLHTVITVVSGALGG